MLRRIRYFHAVVRTGSFSEAAAECYISQSAISQQLRALEQELGFQLLERQHKKFALTAAGEYFYRKTLVLAADYDRICLEAARLAHQGEAALSIGCLGRYSGGEFHLALELFAEKYPEVAVSVTYGTHEELYERLRTGRADLVLNDQRRAFSEEYVNLVLTTMTSYIEVAPRSPLAAKSAVEPRELRDTPCILISSSAQQGTEREYYETVVGFQGDFIYAESLEAARLLVIRGKGFLPLEGSGAPAAASASIARVPLVRAGEPIRRSYCAFRKKNNPTPYAEAFARLLKAQFD